MRLTDFPGSVDLENGDKCESVESVFVSVFSHDYELFTGREAGAGKRPDF